MVHEACRVNLVDHDFYAHLKQMKELAVAHYQMANKEDDENKSRFAKGLILGIEMATEAYQQCIESETKIMEMDRVQRDLSLLIRTNT